MPHRINNMGGSDMGVSVKPHRRAITVLSDIEPLDQNEERKLVETLRKEWLDRARIAILIEARADPSFARKAIDDLVALAVENRDLYSRLRKTINSGKSSRPSYRTKRWNKNLHVALVQSYLGSKRHHETRAALLEFLANAWGPMSVKAFENRLSKALSEVSEDDLPEFVREDFCKLRSTHRKNPKR
ncbi:hypothetical protein [Solimonas soli]|uniref:hypothetical protein n=1 Tax=Solimonas soli TaxID=413479 RepID=UPI0012F98296|nr:hypothetical protein [Solimonas soli]